MTNSNWTGRTARTTDQALGCSGFAGYVYHQPAYKRALYGLVRHGWMVAVAVAVLAVFVLSGCVDMESEQLSADSLRDAVQQAKEQKWGTLQK